MLCECFLCHIIERVVALCCNPLTLQPEQSGRWGSNPTSTFEHHDKGSWTQSALSYSVIPVLGTENGTSPSPTSYQYAGSHIIPIPTVQ